jgi:mannose-1-phosphate guanylyltransferase
MPKPVAPVVCRPFISYVLQNLARHGVRHVIFSAGFLADVLRAAVGDGSGFGIRVDYAVEDKPLGTAGAIRNADRFLDDAPFLALNGDVLSDLDVGDLVAYHRAKGGSGTIYLTPVEDPRRYGLVHLRGDGSVEAFLEKPGADTALEQPAPGSHGRSLINAGVYVLEPEVLELIPRGQMFSIERGVFPVLADRDVLYGYPSDCYWRDIGTPASYLAANFDVLDGTVHSAVADQVGDGYLYVAPSATVAPDARVVPPAFVDEGAVIETGARVGPNAVLGAGSQVAEGAAVEGAVVQEDVRIGARSDVRHAVLVRRCRIGADVQVNEAIVGEGCVVGDGNQLVRGASLAPDAQLGPSALMFRDVLDD